MTADTTFPATVPRQQRPDFLLETFRQRGLLFWLKLPGLRDIVGPNVPGQLQRDQDGDNGAPDQCRGSITITRHC